MVNLPLTDEEIEAKVTELVDRKVREFIKASGIVEEKLRERQLLALQDELNALDAHLDELNEKLDFYLKIGKKIKEMERQLAILTWKPPKSFYEAMERGAQGEAGEEIRKRR